MSENRARDRCGELPDEEAPRRDPAPFAACVPPPERRSRPELAIRAPLPFSFAWNPDEQPVRRRSPPAYRRRLRRPRARRLLPSLPVLSAMSCSIHRPSGIERAGPRSASACFALQVPPFRSARRDGHRDSRGPPRCGRVPSPFQLQRGFRRCRTPPGSPAPFRNTRAPSSGRRCPPD